MIPMLTQETIDREMAEAERTICGTNDRCWVSSAPLERALASIDAGGFCAIGWIRSREGTRHVWFNVDTGARTLRDPPKTRMWFRDSVTDAWRQTEPR